MTTPYHKPPQELTPDRMLKLIKQRIKDQYRRKGMSQEEFALSLGYSGNSAVSKTLSDAGNLSVEFLLKTASALDMNVTDFFDIKEE